MSVNGDEIVLAGYHRDILTGGSWNDITNVFMIHNDDYKIKLLDYKDERAIRY